MSLSHDSQMQVTNVLGESIAGMQMLANPHQHCLAGGMGWGKGMGTGTWLPQLVLGTGRLVGNLLGKLQGVSWLEGSALGASLARQPLLGMLPVGCQLVKLLAGNERGAKVAAQWLVWMSKVKNLYSGTKVA